MSISETGWTPALVAERLAEAADVLARLPEERIRGFYDLWPRILGAPCTGGGPAAAMPEAIDRMDEALSWLTWLEPEERRLVWLRAEGRPWKAITAELCVCRTTAWQRWTLALLKIAGWLNALLRQPEQSSNKLLNKEAGSVLERR
jgi:Domain of unknown function (DUF6362)